MSFRVFSLLFLSFPVRAHAEDEPVCLALPAIKELVQLCEQNSFYVRAAEACVKKLEAEIEVQKNLLAASMAIANASAVSGQQAQMDNHAQNVAQMEATILRLEDRARKAHAEMRAYGNSFMYAGSLSPETAARLHIEEYLQGFTCFAENRDQLKKSMQQVEDRVSQLDRSLEASRKLKMANDKNAKNLDASSSNAVAHGRAPAEAVHVPKGTSANSTSSITGDTNRASDRALRKLEQEKP